jgi:hypothetical protein
LIFLFANGNIGYILNIVDKINAAHSWGGETAGLPSEAGLASPNPAAESP